MLPRVKFAYAMEYGTEILNKYEYNSVHARTAH